MVVLPIDIKEKFYKILNDKITLEVFELWLYSNKNLEKQLSVDAFLDLISINFKYQDFKYKLLDWLKEYFYFEDFETYRLLKLLKEAQNNTERLPFILMEFWNLANESWFGYDFLFDLGTLGYFILIDFSDVISTTADSWEKLPQSKKQELIKRLSPQINEELSKTIHHLETGKIALIYKKDLGLFYSDSENNINTLERVCSYCDFRDK